MANYNLAINIGGQIDRSLYQAINSTQGLLRGLNSGVLANIGRLSQTAVRATMGSLIGATSAVAGFAATSVREGATFDKAMGEVAATMGTTVNQIGNLRELAINMGEKTSFTATQAAEALNYMALAGYDAATSTKMLPNVLNLAAAGNIELGLASDMVTDAQCALGLTIGQTSDMVDQMARTSSKANASVAQLGEGILTVGGTAKYLAGGTVELNTVLGVLADNSIKGAQGGTALRNIIMRLSVPTKAAQQTLKSMGVSAFDAEGKMRSFTQIFPEMQAAMSKMSEKQQLDALGKMFNEYDIAAAQALIGTSAQRWQDLTNEIQNANGAGQQMADTKLDNLAGSITKFQSALGTAHIRLSDQLSPSLKTFVDLGTQGLQSVTAAFGTGGFQGAIKAASATLPKMANQVLAVGPQLFEVGTNLLENVMQGLTNDAQIGIAVGRLASKFGECFVRVMPQLIVGAGKLLAGISRGIVENLPVLRDAALQAAQYFMNSIANAFRSGDPFKQFAVFAPAIAVAIGPIARLIGSLFTGGGLQGGGVVGGVGSLLVGTGGGINPAGTLRSIAGVSAIIGAITGLSTGLGWLANNIDGMRENLRAGAEVARNIGEFIGNFVGGIAGGIAGTTAEIFTQHLPAIGDSLSAFAQKMRPFFASLQTIDAGKMTGFANSLGQMLLTIAGNDLMNAFRIFGNSGDNLNRLAEQIGGFADKMRPTFDKLAGVNQKGVDNAPKVFGSLSSLSGIQFNTGGVAQFFAGSLNLENVGTQLSAFTAAAAPAFNSMANINPAGLEKAPQIFGSLAQIGNYEFKSDGIAQIFTGRVNIVNIGNQLSEFATTATPAFNKLAAINTAGLDKLPQIFGGLSKMGGYEFKSGGVAQLFSGEVNIAGIGVQLASFADNMAPALNKLGTINPAGIDNACKTFEGLQKLEGYALKGNGLAQLFSGSLDLGSVGEQLAAFASRVSGLGNVANLEGLLNSLGAFNTQAGNINSNMLAAATEIDHVTIAFRNLSTGTQQATSQVLVSVRNCTGGIIAAFAAVNLRQTGTDIMQGLINGMNAMRESVLSTARSIAAAVTSTINSTLKVKSPSRVMLETGGYVAEGLALGIESGSARVMSAASHGLAGAAVKGVQDNRPGMSFGKSLGDRVKPANPSQPVTINYNPNYSFNGVGASKQEIIEAVKISQDEFAKMANRWVNEKIRRNFNKSPF